MLHGLAVAVDRARPRRFGRNAGPEIAGHADLGADDIPRARELRHHLAIGRAEVELLLAISWRCHARLALARWHQSPPETQHADDTRGEIGAKSQSTRWGATRAARERREVCPLLFSGLMGIAQIRSEAHARTPVLSSLICLLREVWRRTSGSGRSPGLRRPVFRLKTTQCAPRRGNSRVAEG